MKVFVAIITTDSFDTYAWVYHKEPSRKEIIERLVKYEGGCADFEFYDESTSIKIDETEIL